ncbi:MAG: nucleoside triphosphate pyrophosphohydrolase, partial [Pseudomonadota bacterium]
MTASPSSPEKAFAALVDVMRRLRDPATGCPWDLEQDFRSIAPYTLEEAYEVADAIQRNDMNDLRDELGDLLLQVVFHGQMADEAGHFTTADVANAITNKMIERHPHVFEKADGRSSDGQTEAWEAMKAAERAAKAKTGEAASALDGVALALPALLRALKLQKRAARVGFDWSEPQPIFDKLAEEIAEVHEALDSQDLDAIEDEIGDLLFVGANLARAAGVDPEAALRRSNDKFERRFKSMEALARSRGQDFASLDLPAQDA